MLIRRFAHEAFAPVGPPGRAHASFVSQIMLSCLLHTINQTIANPISLIRPSLFRAFLLTDSSNQQCACFPSPQRLPRIIDSTRGNRILTRCASRLVACRRRSDFRGFWTRTAFVLSSHFDVCCFCLLVAFGRISPLSWRDGSLSTANGRSWRSRSSVFLTRGPFYLARRWT